MLILRKTFGLMVFVLILLASAELAGYIYCKGILGIGYSASSIDRDELLSKLPPEEGVEQKDQRFWSNNVFWC